MFTAWGDESSSDRRVDPDTYILGAVIADATTAENAREKMANLLLPGQRKVHWYDESRRRRDQIIDSLIDCSLDGVVVARAGADDERDERRRRKCFEHFAMQLVDRNVTHLELESRGRVADRRDMEMVRALGASHVIPTSFRVTHTPGPQEPLLWAADAVCGALVAARTGNLRWWRRIERAGFPMIYISLPCYD